MCKQLLAITVAIDPTSSRLALYSSVIEQELASAILILAKRKTWSGEELIKNLREAKRHLLHAQKSLEPEEPETAGAKVSQVISSELSELDAFCRILSVQL